MIDENGVIFWTYACNQLYAEAPLLFNHKLDATNNNRIIFMSTKILSGGVSITRYIVKPDTSVDSINVRTVT